MLELLKTRRSTRKYKDLQVEKADLDKMLKAALLAPSGKNIMPLEFVVIEDKETLLKLETCKHPGAVALKTAPLAIVVIGDTEKSDTWIEDASIASILIQLQAEALDLGSCWIQSSKRKSQTGENSEDAVRKILDIPANYGVLNIITVGHKDETLKAYDESNLNFTKVHYAKY
ncbi:Bifunctional F420 biosynthesis protein FbiB [Sporomusa silvacetica DSM 10669]|uniref:Bifunctional F420 biosynthesis protein FbiB n=1 Tax=Sporomusa silvacetica DSM 10669 TaxID=1123289 RepID=A0ABZ3IF91_9FIRM|nr:nitroreductase family protein [Sporomusa silvacetica]OZC13695.1 NADH dehydrogenase [Sporomusa silvacetica DSM 10669]